MRKNLSLVPQRLNGFLTLVEMTSGRAHPLEGFFKIEIELGKTGRLNESRQDQEGETGMTPSVERDA